MSVCLSFCLSVCEKRFCIKSVGYAFGFNRFSILQCYLES